MWKRLEIWEQLNNPDCNCLEFEAIKQASKGIPQQDGKILSIFPSDGVIHLHGKQDVRNLIQALIIESDEAFCDVDVCQKDYTKLWEQCAALL